MARSKKSIKRCTKKAKVASTETVSSELDAFYRFSQEQEYGRKTDIRDAVLAIASDFTEHLRNYNKKKEIS